MIAIKFNFDVGIIVILLLAIGVISTLFALGLYQRLRKIKVTDSNVATISGHIKDGAMAFLKKEYLIIAPFILVFALFLALLPIIFNIHAEGLGWQSAICFVVGAIISGLAGFIGMKSATKSNALTTEAAAKDGMNKALFTAFNGGRILGISVVAFSFTGLLVLSFLFYFITSDYSAVITIVAGYGLGCSMIALFSRVGGGIFTKAADVGADLVGKVEVGIPEDDPRNPAVIADNVGDNVGDIAGMGSDLTESYMGAIISAITLGLSAYNFASESVSQSLMIAFPLIISGLGIVASVLSSVLIRIKNWKDPQKALNFVTYLASAVVIVGSLALSLGLFGGLINDITLGLKMFGTIVVGVVVGLLIGFIAEYYTSGDYKFVKRVAKESTTGHGTNVISGFAVGLASTGLTIIVIVAGIIFANLISGSLYGIAIAAVAMMSTTGITVAVDGYGPISDNAGGIAEMTHQDPKVRKITDRLDAVGNTTAAVGKGFCIASASFTSIALIISYATAANLLTAGIDLTLPGVIIGVIVGAMLPYILSALTMRSVGTSASHMIEEVRRQFKEKPGIMEGKDTPDYKKCVEIATVSSIKQMILPGAIAMVTPILAGLLIGLQGLGGLLIGALVSSMMLAIMMANAGGAWDNAKKYIEDGNFGGKGSEAHKASVTGDTVGDPFKDTAGPSMDIFIKLMSIISLIIVPFLLEIQPLLDFLFKK